MSALETLEAVYYPGPVPNGAATLTVLGLLFDRIHFPSVHLPESFDEIEVHKEWQRLRTLRPTSYEDVQLTMAMAFLLQHHHVADLCVFTGSEHLEQDFGSEAGAIAHELEEAVLGPFPEGFTPITQLQWVKGIPGTRDSIHAPGTFMYPAVALLYASRHGLPLLNDDPTLPVPGVPGVDIRQNTKLLATILAMECVRLVLPEIPVLTPRAISEMRAATRDLVRPFRLEILRLAGELSAMLASDMPMADVQAQARVLAETQVYPQIEELRAALAAPNQAWRKGTVAFFKEAPTLIPLSIAMPGIALLSALISAGATFAELRDERQDRENKLKRSGFHYLLKLPEAVRSS